MDFQKLVQERYSCKKFTNQPVPQEKLDAILEAGRVAPTAKNLQEQRIYVARTPESLAKIDQITPCRYGAPVVLVVAFDKDNVFHYPGDRYDSGVEDATIIATHMLLASAAEGINSCWLNFFDPDKAAEILGLPANEQAVMLLDLGYAADDPAGRPLENHGKRKAIGETVSYL
jgi:nitroreductase